MDNKILLDFIAEAGVLKRIKRSGWWMVGMPHEESVADHSFRCAVIGYVLSKMENADPLKVLIMTLFNDIHEARINDLHKVASRYIDVRKAEKKAYTEQTEPLDDDIKNDLRGLRDEHDAQKTQESIVARDADILECLIQAKEFTDLGYKNAEKFFKHAPSHLKTESAKKLWESMQAWNSNEWWEKLTKFER